ncbi:hypothetical protein ACH5RR_008518 [Cinchona calisaya]|uniref:DUF4283 domain-containing protein n=1 Tax=Cinchona calisaya TaxID=153742 RepID=A0ABD3AE39_9GENT
MRIIKWTLDFRVECKTPLALVWIPFDQLPRYLFYKAALNSIGRLVGDPLKIDISMANGCRPSKARVCVELDLQKPRAHRVSIGNSEKGFWQPVEYEEIHSYCTNCNKEVHAIRECNCCNLRHAR